MKQSIIYTLALITLGLGSCQKPFELDSPLTPSTEQSSSSSSLAYLKAADLDYSSKREVISVAQHGDDLSVFGDQQVYVYLSKPATEDVRVSLALDRSEAALEAFTKGLTENPGYKIAEEGYAKLENAEVVIPKGQLKSSKPVLVKAGAKYAELSKATAGSEYRLIALRLDKVAEGVAAPSKEHARLFLPVEKEYTNILMDQEAPKGSKVDVNLLDYEVSSAYTGYGKEALYDGTGDFWYAAFGDQAPWFSATLQSGTHKFTGVRVSVLAGYFAIAREWTIYTTTDGETWNAQGVVQGYEINQKGDVTIHFVSPIVAKGIKLAATRRGQSGCAVKEFELYAQD